MLTKTSVVAIFPMTTPDYFCWRSLTVTLSLMGGGVKLFLFEFLYRKFFLMNMKVAIHARQIVSPVVKLSFNPKEAGGFHPKARRFFTSGNEKRKGGHGSPAQNLCVYLSAAS